MRRWVFGLWAATVLLSMAGCATSDSDQISERPWNAPRSWEHGLPPSLYEGR